jgi:hypothetical protein
MVKEFQPAVNQEVTVASNDKFRIKGTGDVAATLAQGMNPVKTIKHVVCVPDLLANCLSISKMVEKGLMVAFSEEGCKLYIQKIARNTQ